MKTFIVLLLMLLITPHSKASVYDFPDKKIHLSLAGETPTYEFNFMDSTSESTVEFKPNLNELTTPGISYKGLVGVSWGFKVNISDEERNAFGESKYEDWRFNYAFNSFMAGVYYSQYTGFYIENSDEVDSAWTNQLPRIQYPDMYVRTLGGHFTWIWDNESFSMPGLVDQTERQEGGGGSWLFGGAIGETTFNNPTGLIPATISSQFPGATGLREGRFTTIQAKGGYGYTLGSRWYLGGLIQVGLGMQKRKLSFQDGRTSDGWDPAWRAEVFVSGGYNGDTFYSGLRTHLLQDVYSGAGMEIRSTLSYGALFFGVHL